MTTESTSVSLTSDRLVDGQILVGFVAKPFIQNDKLLGCVLSFEGRTETALLHLRQMTGEKPAERLAELGVGDPLTVRLMIQQEGTGRLARIWATEKGVEHAFLLDMFEADKEKFADMEGRIHGITDFGVFVELLSGPAQGHRGLLRSSNLSSDGRVKLGSFVAYKPGDYVLCDMAEIRIDDSSKVLIRLANARPRVQSAA